MGDSGIPQPDVSGLPIEAPQSELNLQNASQAMTPQPQAPPLQGTKSGIKDLLSGFLGGMGRSMMTHYGLDTPEQAAQKQQQQQMQQQLAQSTIQYHQASAEALRKQNEEVLIPQPPNPDGTPREPLKILAKSVPTFLAAQQRNAQQAKYQQLNSLLSAQGKAVQFVDDPTTGQPTLQPLKQEQLSLTQQADIAAKQRTATRPSAAARDDRYIQLSGVNPKTWTPEDQQFMKGYSKFVDFTKVQPGLQRAQVFAAPRWAALDPERQAQIALAKGLATGPLANQLSSFNAFVGHLGDFHDAAQQLKNTDIRLFNTGLNRIALETGDPKIQGIIAKIEPVRKEFESLLLNNRALYEADRKSADVILNQASSPAQLEVAIKSLAGTAAIRLGAVNQNVKRISGTDIPELLEPANGSILEELGATIPGYSGNGPSFSQAFKSPQGPPNRTAAQGGGNKIRVKNKATGAIGTLSEKYFDPSKYERQ